MAMRDRSTSDQIRKGSVRWPVVAGFICAIAGIAAATDRTENEKSLNLVPWPKTVELTGGSMKLSATSRICIADKALAPLAKVLAGEIHQITGLDLQSAEDDVKAGDIALEYAVDLKGSSSAKRTGPTPLLGANEAYRLKVTDRAVVSGGEYQGVAWGTVTLLQAITAKNGVSSIPRLNIADKPFAPYRGAMLDLARRMNMIQEIRQCVVLCRLYKIRYLHLHLSDDHAWVFPSTMFPKLGESNTGYEGMAPYVFKLGELKDLVKFADARGVTLIPEVDVPGHTDRLRIDYPLVFDTGEPNKPACMGILNMSFDKAQDGMNTLTGEMIDVFNSSPFFHFGADEPRVDMAAGRNSYAPYMKKMGLADPYELYLHFITLMDSYVKKHGRSSLIWADFNGNSTPRTKVPTDVTCLCWQNDSNAAESLTKQGYPVINATWNPLYAVNAKATCSEITDPARGGIGPMEAIFKWNMYTFDKLVIPPTNKVLGAQVCSWESGGEVQVPLLRWRLPALSERTWSPDAGKTFADFTSRFDAVNPMV
ncbi:MAG: family 20 glycosylhydrolase, partial [bacterium]